MSSNIIDITAKQLLDSRGNPTIEVEVFTEEFIGSALVPSGASTGKHEALELRDNNKAYCGYSVHKAVKNVEQLIKPALLGVTVSVQEDIDNALNSIDGTTNKRVLGANATLGVSLAASRAASAAHEMPLYVYLQKLSQTSSETSFSSSKKPSSNSFSLNSLTLPLPFANVINGGVHAGNDLQVQEFMIVPTGARTMEKAVQMVVETYHELKTLLGKKYGKLATNVGDEGGFAPPIVKIDDALKLLTRAVKQAGYEGKISFAMDAAATEFYDLKKQLYEVEKGIYYDTKKLADYWLKLLKKYPLISLEDPFAEDDFSGWQHFMQLINKTPKTAFVSKKKPQIVGDDLTVTNPERIAQAIELNLCSALLLKVNQIGTLTEAIHAANMARAAGWNVMVSHRSGETEDPYIADLAVGLGCGQIKLGAPCRSDRTAKYNQLLRIAGELDSHGKLGKW